MDIKATDTDKGKTAGIEMRGTEASEIPADRKASLQNTKQNQDKCIEGRAA